jgi:flavin-dependent dehydrogenase
LQADVFVVGGGPAGLSAAIAARLKGFDVTVADAAHPPIDKACGEGILPAGIAALRALGVPISSNDGFPIRGIRSVETRFQRGCAVALRRTQLHKILVNRASELGIRLLWGKHITEGTKPYRARWLIGADGENSHVRRAADLDAESRHHRRFGFRRHYRVMPWTDFVEVHWGPRSQIYVTPVDQDEVGIAVLSEDPHLRLDDAVRDFPQIERRLHGAEASSSERGAATVSRRLRRVFRGNTVLIGDASGSVDAIAGEGLSLSFNQAVALSEALYSGDLDSYQAAHRKLGRWPAVIAKLLLSFDRFPRIRRAVLESLARNPTVASKLLTEYASNGT